MARTRMLKYLFNGVTPGYDEEECGLILGPMDEKVGSARTPPFLSYGQYEMSPYLIVAVTNSSPTPKENFSIKALDAERAVDRVGCRMSDIAGFWHTHTAQHPPYPSQYDLENVALSDRSLWHCVYHPSTGTLTWFDYYDNNVEVEDGRHPVRVRRTRN